ncbi:hypothetical protein BpHYR1_019875 [Brachionus plicatilis]|uniref:Uncharacterized protein n=1 Tax=Brachionus plicatilis TaxID=10195 RepID=A0A3M7T8V7_BRAPC|nr:hypothetical protein BpHYR1_019875 [Brachionus plicatilis]
MLKKTCLFFLAYFVSACSGSASFFLLPLTNSIGNTSISSFKANQHFYSCSSLISAFYNDRERKIIVTNGVIDCDGKNTQNTNSFFSPIVLINLSPSLNQYQAAVTKIVDHFQSGTFSVLHSGSNYHKNLAINIIFRLTYSGDIQLGFFLAADNHKISSFLNARTKLIFAFLDCGQHLNSSNEFKKKLDFFNIKFILVFDSKQCLDLFNQVKENSKNIFKLLASDELELSDVNLSSDEFSNKNKIEVSNYLQDLEIETVAKNFNYTNEIILGKNRTFLMDCNQTESDSFEIRFIYCNRKIDFKLLGSDNSSSRVVSLNSKSYNSSSISNKDQLDFDSQIISFVYIVFGIFLSTFFLSFIFYVIRNRLIRRDLSLGARKLIFSSSDFLDVDILIKENKLSFKNDPIKAGKYKEKLVSFKKLNIDNFQLKDSTLKELKTVSIFLLLIGFD